MNRIARLAVVALALLFAVPETARAGGLSTIPYGDNCWGSGTDADKDGLNDDCEYQVAYWFMPLFWFDSGESGYGRRPYYSVKNYSYTSRKLRIFYMNTYYDDTGMTSGHDGDAEFQIFEVHYSGGKWYMDKAYMSSHRKTGCDGSAWYTYDQLEYDTSYTNNAYRGWPTLYIAEDKHASYNNLSNCDAGCFYQDHCSRYRYQYLDTTTNKLANRNVGSLSVKLINRVYFNSVYEYLLDDVEFKGWDDQSSRANSQGYYRHLLDFSF